MALQQVITYFPDKTVPQHFNLSGKFNSSHCYGVLQTKTTRSFFLQDKKGLRTYSKFSKKLYLLEKNIGTAPISSRASPLIELQSSINCKERSKRRSYLFFISNHHHNKTHSEGEKY